jgi:formylglycine-generating enzyme required for sulfatase activity
MNVTDEEVSIRARRAVLERPDLWAAAAPKAVSTCQNGCCAIPAGKVWTGDTGPDAPPGAPPPRLHAVDAFAIDEGEVTVAAYARCAAAGACPKAEVASSFCSELVKDRDGVPQPCVSFPDAEAYCRWNGGRLPTEAEWMRAARGQTTTAFPWGDAMDLGGHQLRGNFGEKPSTGYPSYSVVSESSLWPSDGYPGLAPPCAFTAGRSPFGVCDLEGNLSEWAVSDGAPAVLGGSWLDGEENAFRLGLGYVIHGDLPAAVARGQLGSYLVGFRCARTACPGPADSAARR